VAPRSDPAPRTVDDSLVEMAEIVLPEDTNPRGSIFGGRVLSLIDKCAAIVAMRHARSEAVTASLDSVAFLSRVGLGDVLLLSGRLNAAFGSSMEVEVTVQAEDPRSGERRLTTTALVTMVAVDASGGTRRVPALAARDDDERRRAAAAGARRRLRLRSRDPGR